MVSIEGRFTDSSSIKVAIVVARFNDLVTNKLLSGCLDCLSRHGIDTNESSSQLDIAWVPGSFELPLVCQTLAKSGNYQVVIALGAVIRGDTSHFDYICAETSRGIGQIGLEFNVPVLFGVLTTENLEQAIARSGSGTSNKGRETALAAVEMATLYQKL